MRSNRGTINSSTLLGWMAADPEMRYLANGSPVCRFRIATKHYAGKDASGKPVYETDWTNVEAWDKLAELVNANTGRGSRVHVTGSIRTDTYDGRDGQKQYRTYVRAEDVIFLDARGGSAPAESHGDDAPGGDIGDEDVPF